MTHLEYLHEPSDVQLGVQREVVDVGDEGGDLLLEEGELILKGIDRHGVVALVVRVVVVVVGIEQGVMQTSTRIITRDLTRSCHAVTAGELEQVDTKYRKFYNYIVK